MHITGASADLESVLRCSGFGKTRPASPASIIQDRKTRTPSTNINQTDLGVPGPVGGRRSLFLKWRRQCQPTPRKCAGVSANIEAGAAQEALK